MRFVLRFVGRVLSPLKHARLIFRVLGWVGIPASTLLGLIAWPFFVAGPALALLLFALLAGTQLERELERACKPAIRIECGNDIHEYVKQWHGSRAEGHPPITLLKIVNTSNVPIKSCRVEVEWDPSDARFPSPADLTWWRDYQSYKLLSQRQKARDLAPKGHGYVVLADQAAASFTGSTAGLDEGLYRDSKVKAWAENVAGHAERHLRLTWPYAGAVVRVEPIDGGPPCGPEYPPLPTEAET